MSMDLMVEMVFFLERLRISVGLCMLRIAETLIDWAVWAFDLDLDED